MRPSPTKLDFSTNFDSFTFVLRGAAPGALRSRPRLERATVASQGPQSRTRLRSRAAPRPPARPTARPLARWLDRSPRARSSRRARAPQAREGVQEGHQRAAAHGAAADGRKEGFVLIEVQLAGPKFRVELRHLLRQLLVQQRHQAHARVLELLLDLEELRGLGAAQLAAGAADAQHNGRRIRPQAGRFDRRRAARRGQRQQLRVSERRQRRHGDGRHVRAASVHAAQRGSRGGGGERRAAQQHARRAEGSARCWMGTRSMRVWTDKRLTRALLRTLLFACIVRGDAQVVARARGCSGAVVVAVRWPAGVDLR